MGNFVDIVIFAAIAAFLVFRLRGVLGKRTGHDQRPGFGPFQQDNQAESSRDKVIPLPDRNGAKRDENARADDSLHLDEAGLDGAGLDGAGLDAAGLASDSPLASGLTQIKLADRGFEASGFVGGSKVAFEMIIGAFAQGDTKTLRPLLSNDVYDDFAGAIKSREDASETLDTTLVGFKEAEIIEAELQGKTAFVTVKFVSDQVNVTRDGGGKVVDGDDNLVATITDIWTFARNTRSRDPNWTLVATRSSN